MFIRSTYLDRINKALHTTKLVILLGARQVGKTTLLQTLQQQVTEPTLYYNCEDDKDLAFTSKQQLIQRAKLEFGFDLQQPGLLLLDEIQAWQHAEILLKTLYDDTSILCNIIVTGSRFWGQTSVASTLVGRGNVITIGTFDFKEFLQYQGKHIESLKNIEYQRIKSALEEYLAYGGYPAVVTSMSKEEKILQLENIIDRWIQKDFGYFFDKDAKYSFLQLLQHITLNIGNIYKAEKLSKEVGISKYHITNMLSFIQDCFLTYRCPPFFTDKTKEFNKHHELFLHDVGLISHFQSNFILNLLHDGKRNENFVLSELQKNITLSSIHYYHKRTGSEIDVILRHKLYGLFPIEVKSKDTTTIPPIFYEFEKKYGEQVTAYIVTTQGTRSQQSIADKTVHFIPFRAITDGLQDIQKTL